MEGETVTPRRVQVALPQWKVPDGHPPMVVLGFDYGGWAAFERPFDASATWTVGHVASGLFVQWEVLEPVAREAARLLSLALPGWPEVVDGQRLADLDDADLLALSGLAAVSSRDVSLKRVTREAFRVAWEGAGPGLGVRDMALRARPARAARPFVVELRRSARLLVFAETLGEVEDAVRAQGQDFFDRFLNERDVDADVRYGNAAQAALDCGVSRSPRGNVSHGDNYFWALDRRLYDPDTAPAHLYLVPGPGDHGHQCPAGPRRSGFGPVEAGACLCQAQVFPGPPDGVHVPRWPGDDGTGEAPRFPDVSCSSCGRAFGPGDAGFSHCDTHAGLVGHD